MLFRIGKCEVWLPDGPAIFAVKPRDIYNKFDFAATDWKHLEGPQLVADSDDSARSTVLTL
jgi:hypothetical protein